MSYELMKSREMLYGQNGHIAQNRDDVASKNVLFPYFNHPRNYVHHQNSADK